MITDADVLRMTDEIDAEIDAACAYAKAAPWPTTLFGEGANR
jgi:hypothetical protein